MTMPTRQHSTDSPRLPWLLLLFVVLHLAVWTLTPYWGHWKVPVDNYDQLDWVQHLAWGYAKHPPFPTWVLGATELLLPHGVATTYALGALFTGAMLWLAWLLTDELLDRRRALISVLLICGITYYTSHVRYFNHNTALMLAHAAATLCIWRCAEALRTRWWVLLGLIWGCGALSKYQMALTIACNVVYLALLARQPGRAGEVREFGKGLLIAGGVCALLLLPHAYWLVSNDFPTFGYASHSMAAGLSGYQRMLNTLEFLGHHVGRAAPMAVVALLLAWLAGLRYRQDAPVPSPANSARQHDALLLLQVHTLLPFALMTLLSLLGGVALQIHWGTAYLWLLGPLFMTTTLGRRLTHLPLWLLVAGVLLVEGSTMLNLAQAAARSAGSAG